jgi:hypothetical protein
MGFALPQAAVLLVGYALFKFLNIHCLRDLGAQPNSKEVTDGKAKPILTTDGKAESLLTDFEAKLLCGVFSQTSAQVSAKIISERSPQTRNAVNVVIAAIHGERIC